MYKILTNNYMSQFQEVSKEVPISLFRRFMFPILHPVTVPFEPWIKTEMIITKERTFMYMGSTIITHPGNYMWLKENLKRSK